MFFERSYLHPIDGTAIDEGRKLSDAISEGVADGRHRHDYVQLVASRLHEHVEQSHRTSVGLQRSLLLAIDDSHFLANLGFFVVVEDVWHLRDKTS